MRRVRVIKMEETDWITTINPFTYGDMVVSRNRPCETQEDKLSNRIVEMTGCSSRSIHLGQCSNDINLQQGKKAVNS